MDVSLEPSRLPTNWLGYTTLRAVILDRGVEELSPAQYDALLMWTASGGDLVFVDGALDTLLPAARLMLDCLAARPSRITGQHPSPQFNGDQQEGSCFHGSSTRHADFNARPRITCRSRHGLGFRRRTWIP
jgi:hypothetical protein